MNPFRIFWTLRYTEDSFLWRSCKCSGRPFPDAASLLSTCFRHGAATNSTWPKLKLFRAGTFLKHREEILKRMEKDTRMQNNYRKVKFYFSCPMTSLTQTIRCRVQRVSWNQMSRRAFSLMHFAYSNLWSGRLPSCAACGIPWTSWALAGYRCRGLLELSVSCYVCCYVCYFGRFGQNLAEKKSG